MGKGVLVLCVLLAGSPALGADASFAVKPTAAREGDKTKITFTVSAPTDVEVAVLDATGRVVRHLAAGVLGPNAPQPLAKDSLAQSLIWDGKDDLGQAATGGPFRVRVSSGMKPTFEKVIGHNPAALGTIVGLAVNPRSGELIVLHVHGSLHPDDGSTTCSVFSRKGQYLRTIYPFPADLPEEGLKGLKRVDVEGIKVPFIYQGETRSLLPGVGNLVLNGPIITRDGRLAFVGHQEVVRTATRYNLPGVKQVTVINTDGSIPEGGPLKTVLADNSQARIMLALSPDEKTVYAAGVGEGTTGKNFTKGNAVHRFGWDAPRSTPFIGDPATPGGGPDRLNGPVDVAVDGEGNIYIADRGNDRVAVFKADGSHLGDLAVDKPKCVEVHPQTGKVYVLAGTDQDNELLTFKTWKDETPAATLTRPMTMALDGSAEPAVLWLASPGSHYAVPPFTLLRIEDRGASFGEATDIAELPENRRPGIDRALLLTLDRRHHRLFIDDKVYDVAAGTLGEGLSRVVRPYQPGIGTVGTKAGMGSIGLDGNFYLLGYPKWMRRLGPDLKDLPFPGGEARIELEVGNARLRHRGVTADRQGNIYVLTQYPAPASETNWGQPNRLAVHGPDGSVTNAALIDSEIRSLNSVCLDGRGNIYLAIGVRPLGMKVPASFEGLDLGKPWRPGMNTSELNWYPFMYGSIAKFGPEGGVIRAGSGGTPVEFSTDAKTEVKGAKWMFFGASPVLSWRQKYPDTCLCESPRIDVDAYGRVFFPDACRFRVGVLDTGGNLIGFFGSYGNQDSAGPASRTPKPAIPLLWPYTIAVGDGALYIGDRLNRRAVRVRLGYGTSETVAIP